MSRFVALKTQFRDREVLQACLEAMHCQVVYQEHGLKMRGAGSPVQLLAHAPFGALGFRQSATQEYVIVADERIVQEQQDFLHQLTQQYAYRKILKDAQAAGYNLVSEEVGADKTIKLVVRKW